MDSFYLFDALGSTRQLTNAAGVVSDSYLYDSFGTIITVTGSTASWFRYVGRLGYYYDEDLLQYYVRARFYSPVLGRFISRDPLWYAFQELNAYRYSLSNFANQSDPSGLDPVHITSKSCSNGANGCGSARFSVAFSLQGSDTSASAQ